MNTKKLVLAMAVLGYGMGAAFDANSQTTLEAEIRVSDDGLVRITHQELMAKGINFSGANPQSIRLSRGSTVLPIRYEGPTTFGANSAIMFFGESVRDNPYTKTGVYRIKLAPIGSPVTPAPRAGNGNCRQYGGTREVFVHDPNRGYDLTSAHTSPWYAQRMVRSTAQSVTFTETFTVADRAAGATGERIEVGVWGGINHAANPDHSIRLVLNGTEIARQRFDGLNYQLMTAALPANTLRNGNNLLDVELVADTGMATDLVYLDTVKVEYPRTITAVANRASFLGSRTTAAPAGTSTSCTGQAQCSKYLITGLTANNLAVYRTRQGANPELIGDVIVKSDRGSYQACFASADAPGDRYWVAPVTSSVPKEINAKPAVQYPLAGSPADYLIISHADFIDGLAPLIAARTQEGHSVKVVDVASIYDYYNKGVVDPNAIGTAIAIAYHTLGTRYVLLVGGETHDYFNYLGAGSKSFLPTYYLPNGTLVRFAPTDMPYTDVDYDGLADVAIGRFPVRTPAELNALVAKTLKYGEGLQAGRLLKVSDRSDGVAYETVLSGLNGVLGANTVSSNISLNNYPNSGSGLALARNDVVSAVNYGNSLLAYFGHSQIGSWAASEMINTTHINGGLFNNQNAPTVVWAMGCYGAYFTSPTADSMAQALMLQSNGGGAVAMLGTTSLSYAASDIAWMNALKPLLRNYPLGEVVRLAQRSLRTMGTQYSDITISGTLLGDPGLQVR